jgi:hypothetical protein
MDNFAIPNSPVSMSAFAGDARSLVGQHMPESAPYGSRLNSSMVLFQADGTPYRSSGRNPGKGDDKTYVDIHNINPYAQVLYTYEGSHGYRDNSYLIFFPREEWYQERQKYSLRSVVAFRAVVDAMVQPVFEKEISRTTDNAIMQAFIDNADNTGTTLQDVNETAQTHARMLGITFIVMDNFSDASSAATVSDATQQRKFPYIYEKMPHEAYRWGCNNWGKLEWITFYEREEKIEDPDHKGQYSIRQYYRRWNSSGWEIYWEKHNKAKYEEFTEIIIESALHGLTYLPVYPVLDYSKNNNLTYMPTPKLADLANMAFVLYNMESWIELLCVYCFPTLTLPDMDASQIAMSATNAIQVPNDAKFAPGFIAPPTSCLEVLLKAADRLEDKIYKAANQLGVSGTRAQTSAMVSGVSKEWDFQATNSLLTKTAYAAEKLELWCAKTLSDYIHQTVAFEVDFGSEFIEAYSNQRLEQIMALIDKMPPEALTKELWKEAVKVVFVDDNKRIEQINRSIDSSYVQDLRDKAALKGESGEGVPGESEKKVATDAKTNNSAPEQDFKSIISNILSKSKTPQK